MGGGGGGGGSISSCRILMPVGLNKGGGEGLIRRGGLNIFLASKGGGVLIGEGGGGA